MQPAEGDNSISDVLDSLRGIDRFITSFGRLPTPGDLHERGERTQSPTNDVKDVQQYVQQFIHFL
jgi:hypothetical protein